jgi:diaminohydroxyphosphoribosylaminopyrimidine deaminase/5-amino-6-(5-phosphoribosylamino)uracil reductase
MSQRVDAETAWTLVRAVTPGTTGRVVLGATRAWMDYEADGSWKMSASPTSEARDVLDVFLPVQLATDLVIGQLGQSLDGRIATEAGASHFITGPKDIERLHRLRALVDAVVVGAETVAQDDPRLTVRLVEGRNPVRVVLDPSGRLDEDRRVFAERGTATLVVRRTESDATVPGAPPEESPGELRVPWSDRDGLDLSALLDLLRARGLRRILVEGGGVTVSRFLQAGLLDRLHLTVAPVLIGSGRPSITLDAIQTLDQAMRPRCRRFTLGEDVLFDLDLRSPPA